MSDHSEQASMSEQERRMVDERRMDERMSDDRHEVGIEAVAKALIDEGCGSGWAYPRAHKIVAAYEQAAGHEPPPSPERDTERLVRLLREAAEHGPPGVPGGWKMRARQALAEFADYDSAAGASQDRDPGLAVSVE